MKGLKADWSMCRFQIMSFPQAWSRDRIRRQKRLYEIRGVTNTNQHHLLQLTSQMSSEQITHLADEVTVLITIWLDLCK